MFENMVNMLEKMKTTCTVNVKNYAIERQRDIAISTRNQINEIRQVSCNECQNQIRLLKLKLNGLNY